MSESALTLVGYIDAGTGSYLLAAVASGAAGIWFYVRSKASKITGRSKKNAIDSTSDASDVSTDSPAETVEAVETVETGESTTTKPTSQQ